MNKYISFLKDFTTEDNTYTYIKNVKYHILKEDMLYYYITNPIKPYPIPKNLKHIVYNIGNIINKT